MASSLPPTKIPVVSDEGDGSWTQMHPSISDVEWRDGFAVGLGINAVTGGLTKSPFSTVAAVSRDSPMDDINDSYVIDQRDVEGSAKLLSTMAACEDFNLAPLNVSLGAHAQIIKGVRNSESSLTCVVSWRNFSSGADCDIDEFALTEDATELARSSPEAFRAKYGDYFIACPKKESVFIAVVALKELQQDERETLAGELGGRLPGFRAEVAAEMDDLISRYRAEYRIQLFRSGLPASACADEESTLEPRNFNDVYRLLQWFKRRAVGVNRIAFLYHYSLLPGVDTIPDRLLISYKAFETIQQIRRLLLFCTTIVNSLPQPYCTTGPPADSLVQQFGRIELALRNAQAQLPTNPHRRDELLASLNGVAEQLRNVQKAYAVFQQVLKCREEEPDAAERQHDQRIMWSHGLTTDFKHPLVKVTAGPSVEIRPGRTVPVLSPDGAHRTIRVDDGSHIVGWEIIPDGKGSWRKLSESVILAREAIITCKSGPVLWDSVWTFKTYIVSNNEYFDNFYQYAEKSKKTTVLSDDAKKARAAKERLAKERPLKG